MDNQRLLIWAFFGVMLFLTWQAWLEDYGSRPQPVSPSSEEAATAAADTALPQLAPAAVSDIWQVSAN